MYSITSWRRTPRNPGASWQVCRGLWLWNSGRKDNRRAHNELKGVQVRLLVKQCYSCGILMAFIIVYRSPCSRCPTIPTNSIHSCTNSLLEDFFYFTCNDYIFLCIFIFFSCSLAWLLFVLFYYAVQYEQLQIFFHSFQLVK